MSDNPILRVETALSEDHAACKLKTNRCNVVLMPGVGNVPYFATSRAASLGERLLSQFNLGRRQSSGDIILRRIIFSSTGSSDMDQALAILRSMHSEGLIDFQD